MHRRAALSIAAFILTLMLALMPTLAGCGSTVATGTEGSALSDGTIDGNIVITDQANADAAEQTLPGTGKQALSNSASRPKADQSDSESAERENGNYAEKGTLDPAERGTRDPAGQGTRNPAEEISAQSGGKLQVHFIDVGQGQAQLVIGPTGKTMLIDGGNNDKEETIVGYLKNQGVERVDILIGTHPDADHIGGLDAVVDHFDIGKIYMPRIQSNTKTFESLLLSIRQKGLKVNTAKAGLKLEWEPDVEVTMVAPVGTYDSTNEMSAVIHLAYGETAFLFTGDAGEESEADILRSGADIGADVLLVGHHGSSASTGEAFLDKVNPAYAVIQVGDNRYGHPHAEVLDRLSKRGIQIYRTDEQGHLVFVSDGNQLSVVQNPWTFNPAEETGTHDADGQSALKPAASETGGNSVSGRAAPEFGGNPAPVPLPASESGQTASAGHSGKLSVSAAIDNETPKQNSKLTVTVKVVDAQGIPVENAEVTLLLHYKTTKTEYRGRTNADGIAELSFRIGRAAKGFTVNGEIFVTAGDASGGADVSFTPK